MKTISLFVSDKIRIHFILTVFAGLLLLTTGKDLLHASLKDYPFYLSESLLFGSFWLLFLPLGVLSKKMVEGAHQKYAALLPLLLSTLHLGLFALLVFSISALFFYHTFGFGRTLTDAVADHSLACLLIYGAGSVLFYKINPREEPREPAGKVRVTHRGRVVFLDGKDILYVTTERPYLALVTRERKYLYRSTLRGFKEAHLSDRFVRIHKSTIVNTDHVHSYQSRQNGDYDVRMANGDTVRASRNYNDFFQSNAE